MSNLARVMVAMLLAALALAWLAWLRSLPSRLALNGAFVLLLYMGTTAGLGICRVANRHLPVFDWR